MIGLPILPNWAPHQVGLLVRVFIVLKTSCNYHSLLTLLVQAIDKDDRLQITAYLSTHILSSTSMSIIGCAYTSNSDSRAQHRMCSFSVSIHT